MKDVIWTGHEVWQLPSRNVLMKYRLEYLVSSTYPRIATCMWLRIVYC